jgi:general secretion pathway protein D
LSRRKTGALFLRGFCPLLTPFLIVLLLVSVHGSGWSQDTPPAGEPDENPATEEEDSDERGITLDFNDVDLIVFTKFVSEIIGKNFIIDERIRGKVTIFSPVKISVDKVYDVFVSVMEMKGFAVVPSEETIRVVPAAEVPVEREIFIYFLENADAEETAKLLTSLVAQKTKPGKAPVRKTPQAVSVAEFEGQIQITPDKNINALIIRATAEDYGSLQMLIEQLDVKRRQVFVEAIIMEVGQNSLREFGTELGAITGYASPDDVFAILGGLNMAPEAIAGFVDLTGQVDVDIADVNVRAVLTALKDMTDANILSTPQILTTHNQKARIVVGQNVPFVTGSSTSTGGLVQRNITRQDVGVTLELTPKVMEGNKVQLDIRQEISTVQDTAESVLVELGPTTNKREAMTSVIVDDRHTVVIGGLMRDDITQVERRIPLLGDIPIIGWLFRFRSNRVVKTNLLIFLTPHILHDAEDLEALRRDKTESMKKSVMDLGKKQRGTRAEFLDAINMPVSNPAR